VLALTSDQILAGAAGLLVANLVIGIVLALVVRSIVAKVLVIGAMVAVGVALWSQRTGLHECVDTVRTLVESGQIVAAATQSCTFFGRDVEIPLTALGR
jgi:hypothetical protein